MLVEMRRANGSEITSTFSIYASLPVVDKAAHALALCSAKAIGSNLARVETSLLSLAEADLFRRAQCERYSESAELAPLIGVRQRCMRQAPLNPKQAFMVHSTCSIMLTAVSASLIMSRQYDTVKPALLRKLRPACPKPLLVLSGKSVSALLYI